MKRRRLSLPVGTDGTAASVPYMASPQRPDLSHHASISSLLPPAGPREDGMQEDKSIPTRLNFAASTMSTGNRWEQIPRVPEHDPRPAQVKCGVISSYHHRGAGVDPTRYHCTVSERTGRCLTNVGTIMFPDND